MRSVRGRQGRTRSTRWMFRSATSIALVVLLAGHAARADAALAEALDNDGKAMMAAGKVAQACEAFEASYRAAPSAGALIHLAHCRKLNGQLASSWRAYKAALARAQNPDKRRLAAASAAALEAQLSYLTVLVSDDSRLAGLTLTWNGQPLDRSSWNRPLPVDGGDFVIAGHAPGYDDWQTVAHVAVERARVSVDVPRLKQLPLPGPQVTMLPASGQAPATTAVAHPTTLSIATDAGRPGRPKLVIALAIAGVVGVGAGVGLELESRSIENQANKACPGTMCGNQHAVDLNAEARRDAIVAIIGFAVGGAAIAGASLLWFVAPAPRQTTAVVPVLGADRVGVSFTRSF
jgi:hypothetical protein